MYIKRLIFIPLGLLLISALQISKASTLGMGTKCGLYYRYLDMSLVSNLPRCDSPMGVCYTYSLTPPEDDVEKIKEEYTTYESLGYGKAISSGRVVKRDQLLPVPFKSDLTALLTLPKNVVSILLKVDKLGNLGDYIDIDGNREYCAPYDFDPIIRRDQGDFLQSQESLRQGYSHGTFVCNELNHGISFVTLSNKWRNEGLYDPVKNRIIRGWFNLNSQKCLRISNMIGLGGYVVLYIETDKGESLTFDADPSLDLRDENLVGISGFSNLEAPLCIIRGSSFRYEVPIDSDAGRFKTCANGKQKVNASLVLKNPRDSSRPLIVRIN